MHIPYILKSMIASIYKIASKTYNYNTEQVKAVQ